MKPNTSFRELEILGAELLAIQKPVTLEMARAQALRITIQSVSKNNKQKKPHIEFLLKTYHPEWTQDQINAELTRLFDLYNEPL